MVVVVMVAVVVKGVVVVVGIQYFLRGFLLP